MTAQEIGKETVTVRQKKKRAVEPLSLAAYSIPRAHLSHELVTRRQR